MAKIENFNFNGKKAIVRVDFNVPLDENGNITDDTRIRGALPTLKKILEDGGSLILMSHMGKPKGKVNMKLSLSQIKDAVAKALGTEVKFAPDCAKASEAAKELKPGEVLLLENLRFYPEEEGKPVGIDKADPAYDDAQKAMKESVLCLDQSGSMGSSVVYSGIFGSVLASIPAVRTRMVVFDTEVADLTDDLQDPVDLLFGVQLGGGTDIARALTYCQGVIARPQETVLVLVTDLYEGGDEREMRKRCASLIESGVQLIVLLALNDEGAPSYDKQNAEFLAGLGAPAFACTPDKFPDLMAAALSRQDIGLWISQNIRS